MVKVIIKPFFSYKILYNIMFISIVHMDIAMYHDMVSGLDIEGNPNSHVLGAFTMPCDACTIPVRPLLCPMAHASCSSRFLTYSVEHLPSTGGKRGDI
jgi:hypothetical protein